MNLLQEFMQAIRHDSECRDGIHANARCILRAEMAADCSDFLNGGGIEKSS
jgi:hypothetical protein